MMKNVARITKNMGWFSNTCLKGQKCSFLQKSCLGKGRALNEQSLLPALAIRQAGTSPYKGMEGLSLLPALAIRQAGTSSLTSLQAYKPSSQRFRV